MSKDSVTKTLPVCPPHLPVLRFSEFLWCVQGVSAETQNAFPVIVWAMGALSSTLQRCSRLKQTTFFLHLPAWWPPLHPWTNKHPGSSGTSAARASSTLWFQKTGCRFYKTYWQLDDYATAGNPVDFLSTAFHFTVIKL